MTSVELNPRVHKAGKLTVTLAFLWVLAAVLAARFLYTGALAYRNFDESTYGADYLWPMRYWAAGHIVGGTVALTVGLVQMLPAIRRKYIAIHRWGGRLYVLSILLAATSALVLAPTVSLNTHWSWAVALASTASVWIIATLLGYRAIRLNRVQQHKEWMIRSYVITFGFVIFRILNTELFSNLGEFVERGPTFSWASWSVPLFITEVCLQWNKK